MASGRRDKYGAAGGLKLHLQGARGEVVVAQYLGEPLNTTVSVFNSQADVGSIFDVKTRYEDWHELMVRESELPYTDRVKVLCIGQEPGSLVRVVGFISYAEVPVVGRWEDPNGRGWAWFVNQDHLHRFNMLPEEVAY